MIIATSYRIGFLQVAFRSCSLIPDSITIRKWEQEHQSEFSFNTGHRIVNIYSECSEMFIRSTFLPDFECFVPRDLPERVRTGLCESHEGLRPSLWVLLMLVFCRTLHYTQNSTQEIGSTICSTSRIANI